MDNRTSDRSKAKLSVGDDTPSGEPEVGPQGPYVTDDSDDMLADRKKPQTRRKDVADHRERSKI